MKKLQGSGVVICIRIQEASKWQIIFEFPDNTKVGLIFHVRHISNVNIA
jgi:hypothetical protein